MSKVSEPTMFADDISCPQREQYPSQTPDPLAILWNMLGHAFGRLRSGTAYWSGNPCGMSITRGRDIDGIEQRAFTG
jgi:hypothetical protein